MSGLIKANNNKEQVKIRYLTSLQESNGSRSSDKEDIIKVDPRDEKIIELTEEISRLNSTLDTLINSTEDKIKQAHDEAIIKGREEADSDEKSRLLLLESNIEVACNSLLKNMAELEKLSLAISHRVLSKILGDTNNYKSMIAESIKNHTRQLSDKVIVSVKVSADDFVNEQEFLKLTENFENIEIIRDTCLNEGGCEIQLLLGHVDIGIDKQWVSASKLITEMIET